MRTVLAISIMGVLHAGCGSAQDPLEPPKIFYGEDPCIQCSMIISEERYAAAMNVELPDGRRVSRLFDDVGDMLEYMAAFGDEQVLAAFVHDYDSHEWIDAITAMYLHSPLLHTPMASGVGAFTTRAGAQVFQETLGGEILDWQGIKAMHAKGTLLLPQVIDGG